MSRLLYALIAAGMLVAFVATALADPPAWAPAHGRRAKDGNYLGYGGYGWPKDYGVLSGRCNTDQVLTVVGAVAGGVIGNRTASPENRAIATLAGALIGGVIGNRIGDSIDDRDRACIGHSLELVGSGRQVTWINPTTGMIYVVRPLRDIDGRCREFEFRNSRNKGKGSRQQLRACRDDGGTWVVVPVR